MEVCHSPKFQHVLTTSSLIQQCQMFHFLASDSAVIMEISYSLLLSNAICTLLRTEYIMGLAEGPKKQRQRPNVGAVDQR